MLYIGVFIGALLVGGFIAEVITRLLIDEFDEPGKWMYIVCMTVAFAVLAWLLAVEQDDPLAIPFMLTPVAFFAFLMLARVSS